MKSNLSAIAICLVFGFLLSGCSKSGNASSSAGIGNSQANPGSSAQAAAPTELKIKWEAGKKYSMEMDLDQTTGSDAPNQPPSDLKLTQDLHFSPLQDLADGGHQVELQFDSQKLDLTQNGRELINYDSTQNTQIAPNSPLPPVAAVMRAMIGVPLDYTMAADGSVQKIDGLEALKSRITAVVNPQQAASMRQLYDEDTLKQYGSIGEALPDHPVNLGDSWTMSHDITSPVGIMTIKMTYTFQDWQQHDGRKCAHIIDEGDITTKSASAAMTGAVVDVQKGKISGEFWFDPDLGMLVDMNDDQDMTLKITTRMQSFKEELKQNIQMSLLDVTP